MAEEKNEDIKIRISKKIEMLKEKIGQIEKLEKYDLFERTGLYARKDELLKLLYDLEEK